MNKYTVTVEMSGYVRGYAVYEVQAESEYKAIELAQDGAYDSYSSNIVSDDTECEWDYATVEEVE